MIEESFDDLYHQAACGQLSTTVDDVIITVNDTLLSWIGYGRDEILGKRLRDLLTGGSQIFYETRYQPVLRLKGEVREVALSMSCADASVLSILLNARVVENTETGTQVVRTAIFDSTERRDYERELLTARRAAEVSERRVRILQAASSSYVAATTESELAEALAASAREAFEAADAAVVFANESGSLRVTAGAHLLDALIGLRAARRAEGAVIGPNVITVTSLANAEDSSPEAAEILRDLRMEALSAVPLVGENGILGVLVLFYGRARAFDESTIELHEALGRQASLVLDRIRLQRELEQLAMHDQLTALANRNLLRERLSQTLAFAERSREPMALIFFDLDGFKLINDDLGHRVGDTVLQIVAGRANGVVREADVVGRYGGDEFLIICQGADEDAAMLIAQRVAAVIAEPIPEIAADHRITASIGIAAYLPGEGPTPTNDSIVRIADVAMYESKNSGVGRITLTRI
jgi:diguanylate cyclase (GGDEF)-like protein/PAS domain S-box-containing protein